MAIADPYASELWRGQYSTLLWGPVHSDITIPKWLPHPLSAGFVRSVGETAGQLADYRLPLDDGREVHVREFDSIYTAHLDQVSALRNPIGHLMSDAPHWIGLALLGLLVVVIAGIILYSGDD